MAPPDDDSPEYPSEDARPKLLRWENIGKPEAELREGMPTRRATDHSAAYAIGLAGWDLSDPDEMYDFVETMRAIKKRRDRIKAVPARRAAFVWAILGTVGGAFVTFEIPRIATWLTGLAIP